MGIYSVLVPKRMNVGSGVKLSSRTHLIAQMDWLNESMCSHVFTAIESLCKTHILFGKCNLPYLDSTHMWWSNSHPLPGKTNLCVAMP